MYIKRQSFVHVEMIVQCFTVTVKRNNPIEIETFYTELRRGSNIPKYLQYEGGSGGNTFLFCIDKAVNVQEICDKYKYECGTIYQLEIEEDTYNHSYTTYPTYAKDGPKFILQNIKISYPYDA